MTELSVDRVKVLRETVEKSTTKLQFEHRKRIFERLWDYFKESVTDEEFYAKLLLDADAWSAMLLNNDAGKPIFPAPWQSEYDRALDTYPYVWALCTRKCGKSTQLSVKIAHTAAKSQKRIVCYAPTHGQDFVYQDVRRFFTENTEEDKNFLYKQYLEGSKTKDTTEEMVLTNGSRIINRTIGISSKGQLTLGEKGDIVVIDEIELIEKSIFTGVIKPILADAYSEKHLWMIGTPALIANPSLNIDWDNWGKCEKCSYIFTTNDKRCHKCGTERDRITINVDWKRAVREGCLNEKYIKTQQKEMTPDEFAMYYEAKFPDQSDRFYPLDALHGCLDDYRFSNLAVSGRRYIMSVDWSKYIDRTQILVAEFMPEVKALKYVYWKEIDPRRAQMDYDKQVELVKTIFHQFNCDWIIVDATSHQDSLVEDLIKGERLVPSGKMFKDEKERLGYKASDDRNYDMHRNHKTKIETGRIIIPKNEIKFFEQWITEHNQLQAVSLRSGALMKLQEPKNGFKDLAICSAMMSIYLKEIDKGPPMMEVYGW